MALYAPRVLGHMRLGDRDELLGACIKRPFDKHYLRERAEHVFGLGRQGMTPAPKPLCAIWEVQLKGAETAGSYSVDLTSGAVSA